MSHDSNVLCLKHRKPQKQCPCARKRCKHGVMADTCWFCTQPKERKDAVE